MFPDRAELYGWIAYTYERENMFADSVAADLQALSLRKDPNVSTLAEACKRDGYRGYLLKQIQILEQ